MFEFIKWCFKDAPSTIITIIVLIICFEYILDLAKILMRPRNGRK